MTGLVTGHRLLLDRNLSGLAGIPCIRNGHLDFRLKEEVSARNLATPGHNCGTAGARS
jgi:hypothetical protein